METTGSNGLHAGGSFLCSPNEEDCLLLGENDARDTVNFDHIGVAIMSIFQIMTLEGWADLCYKIQDAVGYWHWIFFVLLIMIGTMFVLQLFLVVIATRHAELEAEKAHATDEEPDMQFPGIAPDSNKVAPDPISEATNAPERLPSAQNDEQTNTEESALERRLSSSKKEYSTVAKFRFKLRLFAKSEFLSNLVMGVILLSTAFMACEGLCEFDPDDCSGYNACLFHGPSCTRFKASLEIINLIFNIVFCFELAVKIPGIGPIKFFRGPGWAMNVFDTVIVILCMVDFAAGIEAATCYFNYAEGSASSVSQETLLEMFTRKLGDKQAATDRILGVSKVVEFELSPTAKQSLFDIPRVLEGDDGVRSYNPMIYYFCVAGGPFAVLRALRLVRLVKFLRNFPEVTKQFQILADVMASIFALLVLIMIMIFIFTLLGMNFFGGQVVGEYPPEDGFGPGMEVYVVIPWDDNGGVPRHGKIHWTDFENHALTPYKVELEFGGNKGGGGGYDPVVNISVGGALDEYGYIWAAAKGETIQYGVPYIDDWSPRFHFDNFGIAFLTSFQVFTMANWNDDLYDVLGSTKAVAGSLYFYVNIVVGNWILLNLFIAILIGKFSEQRAAALDENLDIMEKRLLEKLGDLSSDDLAANMQKLFASIDLDGSGEIDKFEFNEMLLSLGVTLKPRELQKLVDEVDEDQSGRISFGEFMAMIKNLLHNARVTVDNKALNADMEKAKEIQDNHMLNQAAQDIEKERLPVSCCIIQEEWTIRQWSIILTNENGAQYGSNEKLERMFEQIGLPGTVSWKGLIGPVFANYILLCILLSTVCLAMATPWVGENSKMTKMMNTIDIILNISFTIELFAKIIAQSWSPFWKSPWNKLDFFIVFTSDLEMILTYALSNTNIPLSALRIFRVFRIFRALRPLRIIARARGVRLLVGTLFSAVKPVSVTLAIACGILFVLGIFFVQFLGGGMKSCSDGSIFTKPLCKGLDGDGNPLSWGTSGDVNFDNIYTAFIAMFILSSQDDWPSHLFASMDGTGPLTGPKENTEIIAALFFILALLITSAIVINMFVGVFVDCYYGAMAEVDADPTDKNKPLHRKILNKVFDDPKGGARERIFEVVQSSKFDMLIAFFIVFNVLAMATASFKPSDGQIQFEQWSNYFFTFIFGWECVFKMYALAPSRYFTSGWNKFDFFIVTISFVDVLMTQLAGLIEFPAGILRILRIFRIFRILRAFRIFKSLKDLQNIAIALANSAGQVMNLTLLLMLLFFIFGVLGTMIGGHMCVAGDEDPPQDLLDVDPLLGVRCAITNGDAAHLETHGHFQGVGVSLLTLWRIATSDAWGDIMMMVSLTPPERTLNPELIEIFHAATLAEGNKKSLANAADIKTFSKEVDELIDTASKELKLPTLPEEKPGRTDGHERSVEIAVYALLKNKQSVTCVDDCADSDVDWLNVAANALPDCLEEDEANFLSRMELMSCKNPGEGYSSGDVMCPGTCGFNFAGLFYSVFVAQLYFLIFVSVSSFVLLQLVIAVLMDQLTASSDDKKNSRTKAPGMEDLTVAVFTRAYRRFNYNARRKLVWQNRKARGESEASQK